MTEKKVVGSKNEINKSCPKFYKLGDDFFLFWQNLKTTDARAKKRFSDFAYKIRVLALEPQKVNILTKKIIDMLKYPREIILHHFWVYPRGGNVRPPPLLLNVVEITCGK